jgi:hypothetical protein
VSSTVLTEAEARRAMLAAYQLSAAKAALSMGALEAKLWCLKRQSVGLRVVWPNGYDIVEDLWFSSSSRSRMARRRNETSDRRQA